MRNGLYKGSLALRVLAVTVVVFALPMLIYFMIVFRYGYDQRLSETALRLRDLGYSRATQLSQLISFNMRALDILSETLAVHFRYSSDRSLEDQAKEINPILTEVADGGNFTTVFFLALLPGGRAVAIFSSDPSMIGMDYSSYDLTSDVLQDGSAAMVAYGSTSFNKLLYVAKLVYSQSTYKPIGILGVTTSVTDLIHDLLETEDAPYPVNFSLLTEDNVVFASGNPDLTMRSLQPTGEDDSSLAKQGSRGQIKIRPIKNVPGAFEIEWKGKRSIAIEVPIEGTDLKLLLDADEKVVYGDLYSHLLHVLGIFFILLALGGWAALWLTQRMSQPLNRLTDVMNRVSEGDLTARFEADRMGFEINSIGEIFNQTILSLRHQMRCAENERVQKETLKKELNIGQEIQMSILPNEWPAVEGVEIAARYVPAKEVGGDFYDIFAKEHRKDPDKQDLVITVADASGKGISACLYSLCVRSMLRSFCIDHDDVATIVERTNDLFCQDTGLTGVFVTALTAIYCPESRELRYTSAGHNPAFLRRRNGELEALTTRGVAMGVELVGDRVISSAVVTLEPGDTVLFYTDGITEAHNPHQDLFGEERLKEFLALQRGKSANAVADGLLAAVRRFAKGAPQHDDITVIVMRLVEERR